MDSGLYNSHPGNWNTPFNGLISWGEFQCSFCRQSVSLQIIMFCYTWYQLFLCQQRQLGSWQFVWHFHKWRTAGIKLQTIAFESNVLSTASYAPWSITHLILSIHLLENGKWLHELSSELLCTFWCRRWWKRECHHSSVWRLSPFTVRVKCISWQSWAKRISYHHCSAGSEYCTYICGSFLITPLYTTTILHAISNVYCS